MPTRKGPVRADFGVRTEAPPCLDELGGEVAIRGAANPLGAARLQTKVAANPKDPRRTLADSDPPLKERAETAWARRLENEGAEMDIRIPASRRARCWLSGGVALGGGAIFSRADTFILFDLCLESERKNSSPAPCPSFRG